MNICLDFLRNVTVDLFMLLTFEIIPGISIWTLFFYSLLASSIFTVFTRR